MKALVCGFWDGKSLIPIEFSIHNEPGKNKKRGLKTKEIQEQFKKERDPKSPGFQRLQQLHSDKIASGISMVKNAIKAGLKPTMFWQILGLCAKLL